MDEVDPRVEATNWQTLDEKKRRAWNGQYINETLSPAVIK